MYWRVLSANQLVLNKYIFVLKLLALLTVCFVLYLDTDQTASEMAGNIIATTNAIISVNGVIVLQARTCLISRT